MLLSWVGEVAYSQNKPFYPIYKRKEYTECDSVRGKLTFARACFDVVYYDLTTKIIPKKKRIEGHNVIHFRVVKSMQKMQLDLYDNLKIDSVVWRNKKMPYLRKCHAFFIDFPETLEVGKLEQVAVYYQGKPLEQVGNWGRHGVHWTKDAKIRDWIGVSCEHDGASIWWPNKDHLSDEPDSMRIHIIAPSKLQCISNGRLEQKTVLPNTDYTQHDWVVRNPINNYNVTFYLGHYIKKVYPYENAKGKYEIETYALDYEQQDMETYYKFVPEMVKFLELMYGEYAFWNDKLAILQSSYLGMEHQGCLAIGSKMKNYDNWYYSHKVNWHSTLIHEMAHEWWGNSVSVSDMADVWLHEAFATYSEFAFMEYVGSKEAYQKSIEFSKTFVRGNFPIVGNRDVNENMFSDGDIYHRGARVIHELRDEIGNTETFLKIHRVFQERFKKKNVTTQDYINVVNEVSGRDLTKFLMDRLYQK